MKVLKSGDGFTLRLTKSELAQLSMCFASALLNDPNVPEMTVELLAELRNKVYRVDPEFYETQEW